jgi:hypothetical protein
MQKLVKAILKTLAYADVFDYPLTAREIWKLAIDCPQIKLANVDATLKAMGGKLNLIGRDGLYFFWKKRRGLVALREKRQNWSRKKMRIAQRVANWLKWVPWVKMVAVTGSLAILNSDRADDIDILIVSARKRLWLTRLLVTALVELTGKRRRPPKRADLWGGEFKDKICLNMFLDEDHLTVAKKEQDLFSAHEVCQMRPLWNRDKTYEKFLYVNRWVRKYLPNAINITTSRYYDIKKKRCKESRGLVSILISRPLNISENFVRDFQLWYMKKRRTTEVISEGVIRFHPKDARDWVLKEYNSRVKS